LKIIEGDDEGETSNKCERITTKIGKELEEVRI
jgi:hypothetical protein